MVLGFINVNKPSIYKTLNLNIISKINKYSLSLYKQPSINIFKTLQYRNHILSYLNKYLLKTLSLRPTYYNLNLRNNTNPSPFHNKYFFLLESQFLTKFTVLIGSPVPGNLYDFSSPNNISLTSRFLDLSHKANNVVSNPKDLISTILTRIHSGKNSRTKRGTNTIKLNAPNTRDLIQNANTKYWLKYKKNKVNYSIKKSSAVWKRRFKKNFLLIKRLKFKTRKKILFLKSRLRKLTPHKNNSNKTRARKKSKSFNLQPLNTKNSSLKTNYKLKKPLAHTFNTFFRLSKSAISAKKKTIIRNNYTSLVFIKHFYSVISIYGSSKFSKQSRITPKPSPLPTRQSKLKKRLDSTRIGLSTALSDKLDLTYKLPSFSHFKKITLRKNYRNRLPRKLIKLWIKIHNLKRSKLPQYLTYIGTFLKRKPHILVTFSDRSLPQHKPKWYHVQPYLFTNLTKLHNYLNNPLTDKLLDGGFQHQNSPQSKSLNSQLFFYKNLQKLKKHNIHLNTILIPRRGKFVRWSYPFKGKFINPLKHKTLSTQKNYLYTKITKYLPPRLFSFKKKQLLYNSCKSNKLKNLQKILPGKSFVKKKEKPTRLNYNRFYKLKSSVITTAMWVAKKHIFRDQLVFSIPNITTKYKTKLNPRKNSPTSNTVGLKSLLSRKTYVNHKLQFTKISSLDYIPLKTRTQQPFLLKSPIMFLLQFFLKNSTHSKLEKFLLKKKIFSFLQPNEVRKALLDRKLHFFTYELVYNTKSFLQKNLMFIPSKLKKLYTHTLTTHFTNSPAALRTNSYNLNKTYDFNLQNHTILDKATFSLRGINQVFQRNEIRIPRVRFKPGYQRMWRRSRLALKEALGVKFLYQQKLTQHLSKFIRTTNYYAFSASETTLDKTIIYSRLLPDLPTLTIFLDQRLIYLNGQYIKTLSISTYENDFIQLIISKWYYAAYRWITNWTLKRIKKYKHLVYRKGLSNKYKLMKQRKQKSYHTPKWIYLTKYDMADIKPYLEVDYLTLSVIVVYNPYIFSYHSPMETPDYRPTIYRLYNWKYIT